MRTGDQVEGRLIPARSVEHGLSNFRMVSWAMVSWTVTVEVYGWKGFDYELASDEGNMALAEFATD